MLRFAVLYLIATIGEAAYRLSDEFRKAHPDIPSRAEAQKAGEEVCRPIIAALEKYHSVHARYPDTLEDLVASKLIDQIPDTPEIGKSKRGDVTYEVSLPTDVYQLSFSYDVSDGLFGAIIQFSYMPDEAEWQSAKYPPSFWDETCDRAAKRYRKDRDEASLRAFIETVTVRPDTRYFSERRVKEWLGEGDPKAIPHELSAGKRMGTCYGSKDGSTRICFSYRPNELPSRTARPRTSRSSTNSMRSKPRTASKAGNPCWKSE